MKKQNLTTSQERKMKFAEAGILVALVLILSIFVGIKISDKGSDEIAVLESTSVEVVKETEAPSSPVETVVTESSDSPDAATEVAIEEAAIEPVVESESITISEPVTYASAEEAFQSGQFEEAAIMFSRYTDDNRANAWGFYMLGLSEWKAGDLDGAEDAFLHALELKPDHQKSLVNYGRVLIAMDRSSEARDQVELALAANPGSVEAIRVMGRINHNLHLLDEAVASYRTVLEFQADDVWALNNLGLIYIEQENFEAALAPLAKASILRQDVACIQNNLGVALERTGYFQAAGEAFTLALEADPNYDKADQSLARVSELQEATDLEPVDLAALAASFGQTIQEGDMEVASAYEPSLPTDNTPETD